MVRHLSEPCPDIQPNGCAVIRTKKTFGISIVVLGLAALGTLHVGCHKPAPNPQSSDQSGRPQGTGLERDELFGYAIDTLDRLEEFDDTEMLQQAVNQLDRWVARQPPPDDWKPDPFIVLIREGMTSCAAEIRAGAAGVAEFGEIDGLETMKSRLEELSQRFEGVGKQLDDLGEETHLADIKRLSAEVNTRAEVLKLLPSTVAADTPEETVGKIRSYLSETNTEGNLEALAVGMEEFVRRIDVEELAFSPPDGLALQEAVWFRNISRWVAGDDRDAPLEAAIRLFDWTIRNIQLNSSPSDQAGNGVVVVLQQPWETLLFGSGSIHDRIWTFLLLLRQQRIDAALLVSVDPEDPEKQRLKLLGVGVLVDGEVYVFDPRLGLAIPGPEGVGLDDEGQLTVQPATLSQLAADDSLLRQVDLDSEHSYGLRSSDFQEAIALLEMSPKYLLRRMRVVESQLSGEDRLVLTIYPEEQAAGFMACPQVVEWRHWEIPFGTIRQMIELAPERAQWQVAQMRSLLPTTEMNALLKGREYHFKGVFSGDPNAIIFYQDARRSRRELSTQQHRLEELNRSGELNATAVQVGAEILRFLQVGKMNAGYWLGLIHAHQGNNRAAIDYFRTRTLEAFPGGKWQPGAIYNLARTYEADKQYSNAVDMYRLDRASPYQYGNLLRAKWLESLAKTADPTEPAEGGDEAKEEVKGSP